MQVVESSGHATSNSTLGPSQTFKRQGPLAGAVYTRPMAPLRPSSSATNQSGPLNKTGWVKNMEGDDRDKGENVESIAHKIHKVEVTACSMIEFSYIGTLQSG